MPDLSTSTPDAVLRLKPKNIKECSLFIEKLEEEISCHESSIEELESTIDSLESELNDNEIMRKNLKDDSFQPNIESLQQELNEQRIICQDVEDELSYDKAKLEGYYALQEGMEIRFNSD